MLQEDRKQLSKKALDFNMAIDSLREELEAINFYKQRAETATNPNLKKILLHNADEEKEHAAMLLSWIEQQDKFFSEELKKYLFTKEKDITKLE
jgi:hypothetical protein